MKATDFFPLPATFHAGEFSSRRPTPARAGRGINIEIEGRGERVSLAGFIIWSKDDLGQPWMLFPGGMGVQLLDYQKDGLPGPARGISESEESVSGSDSGSKEQVDEVLV